MTKVTNISVIPEATQNFVEVYKRKRLEKQFGSLEKRLIAAVILSIGLAITFLVLYLMTRYYYNQISKEKVCTSKECIESAMTLLQSMDFSQDPCEDFYRYACGKFEMDHPIPEDLLHYSWFAEKESRLNRLVLNTLKSSVSSSDLKSVAQTKEFFKSCTNRSELNSIGLQPLYDILELLELPKSVPSSKTAENFNLGKTLALAQRYLSQDIIVAVSISRGIANSTEDSPKNMTFIKVSNDLIAFTISFECMNVCMYEEPPTIVDPTRHYALKRIIRGLQKPLLNPYSRSGIKLSAATQGTNIFDVWKYDNDIFNPKVYKFRRKTEEKGRSAKPVSSAKQIKATIRFISSIIREINNDLEARIEEEIDNTNNSSNQVTAMKIITFTSELIKDTDGGNETENATTSEQMTFSSLQVAMDSESKTNSSSNRIDWREYISTLFENINKTYDIETEPIIVDNLEYFKYLSKVLGDARPETIQRHIWWKIIEQYAKHTTTDMRAIYLRYYSAIYGESGTASRSYICTNLMKNTMNVALSYEMARMNNFSAATQKVHEMLQDIEKAFEILVESITWMDNQTKAITLDKAKSVTNQIGYASWITNATEINKYYDGLELKPSEFLMNIKRISEWEVRKILLILGPQKDGTNQSAGWFVNPLQVNAYYSREDNAIIIPAGIMQTPFYFRGLESLNYGAIGTILGHELTHGFDIDGKNYNKFGKRQENWWPNDITSKYEAKAKCFVDQYENFTLYDNNKLNGTYTLSENIADNGGIRESFKAYQLYSARHGPELKLPGFENFTHEQLLFLSYANIWCEASTQKYYKLSQDSHSPQKIRVLATLQNMKEFSIVYNCSENSFMNPVNKCVIW